MKRFLPVLLLILIPVPLFSQDLLSRDLQRLLLEELSGERAKEHVIRITRFHRVQASPGYRQAAEYVLQQLRKAGFSDKDAFMESYPSDGKIHYQTWQSPSGWSMEEAELWMVEPEARLLVRYPDVAMSLITYSNPGDVTAELVWVGTGTRDEDYTGKDVRGKFVLATGYGGEVHRKAVLKFGARAVVCYLNDERAKRRPDMLAYTGMWPRPEEVERVTFGFNISYRQGEMLRRMLESGKRVVLHGRVRGKGLYPFFMDVVVARIQGQQRPEETLVFCAHLDHPKEAANDNASGSAAMLDIAITLKRLIDGRKLPPPKRSFLFLWVPEWHGTMAYLDKHPEFKGPDLGGTYLAGLNLDMVGEHLELLHSKMILTRTPSSIPSILNDVVASMAGMVDRMTIRTARGSETAFNFRVAPYGGGSDHMMLIDRKIPCMMIGHSPDYTHHTSDDVPERVDPVELERTEIIALGALWYLANLTPEQARDAVYLAYGNAVQRLAGVQRSILKALTRAEPGYSLQEAQNKLLHHVRWEQQVLRSVLKFENSRATRELVGRLSGHLKRTGELYMKDLRAYAKKDRKAKFQDDDRIPVRLTRGPLAFDLPESKLPANRARWYRSSKFPFSGNMRFELVNFIDGKRTVKEIRDALSAEFRPVALEDVARYLEDLVQAGLVKWKK
jgi:hypothetical protein